jgi:hypothetical protein
MYFDDIKITKLLIKEAKEKLEGKRKQPSDEITQSFIDILEHSLSSRKYSGYSPEWKDEFRGLAYEKFVKHWFKFKPDRAQKNYFQRNNEKILKEKEEWGGAHGYFTTIVISSIHDIIRKFKKEKENRENLVVSYNKLWEQEWYKISKSSY